MIDNIGEQRPFYLKDKNTFTDLETQMSIVPPSLREKYKTLENVTCNAFLEKYGKYLNKRQMKYLRTNRAIFTDYDMASGFSENWDKGIASVDLKEAPIGDDIYLGYSAGDENRKENQIETPDGQIAGQFWAGRLAIYPLGKEEVFDVDTKWLMTERKYDEFTDKMNLKDTFASIQPYVYTNLIGGALVHEKIHGIQDYRLPIPILEAAAHYYQRDIFNQKGWYNNIGSNMDQLANYYGQCIAELGEDLHRLMFGNITNKAQRDKLIEAIKSRFTTKKIEELSKHNQYDWMDDRNRWIYWRKSSVQAVRQEIQTMRTQKPKS